MAIAFLQHDSQYRAAHAVFTVHCLNLTAMHIDDSFREIEADARTVEMQVTAVAPLIEAVKETLGLVFIQADAIIAHLNDYLLFLFYKFNIDFSAIKSIFEGIG